MPIITATEVRYCQRLVEATIKQNTAVLSVVGQEHQTLLWSREIFLQGVTTVLAA